MKKFHHPPAFCPVHGIVPATSIALGVGAMQNTFIGCSAPCPQCQRSIEVLPGTYDAHSDRLNFLLDPSISKEALQHLKSIAERAARKEITAEEAREQASKIGPKAGKLFDIGNWSDQAQATLYASIIAAAAVLGAAKMTSSSSTPFPSKPLTVHEKIVDHRKDKLSDSTAIPFYVPVPTPRPK